MNDVVRTAWANAGVSKNFIYVKTYSGYGSSRADPLGVEHHTGPEISDQKLGIVVLDALA